MCHRPQHSDTPQHASPGPGEVLPVEEIEAVIEQARQARRRNADDIARRLGRGERLNAEQLYDTLHAQTLATWWLLADRLLQQTRDGHGLTPEQIVNRFAFWIRPYADHAIKPDPTPSGCVPGLPSAHDLALAHFDRALALIRHDADRTFLAQIKTLVPALLEQAPSSSTGKETDA